MAKKKTPPKKSPLPPWVHPALAGIPLISITDLNLDPENERSHPRANIDSIKGSLQLYGVREPIGVQRDGMLVTRGNGTTIAIRELAAEKAPGKYPGADPSKPLAWDQIPWLEFDDDRQTAAGYRVTHNRTSELAQWDWQALTKTLGDLSKAEVPLGNVGWTPGELAALPGWDSTTVDVSEHEREIGGDQAADPAADPDEDVIPETPVEPVTKFGEVIQLGPHTLHCQDCMVVMSEMPDNSVDGSACDPPYGLSPDGAARTWDDIEALRAEGKAGPSRGFMGSAWDAGVPGITWAREVLRVHKPGAYIVAFSASRTIHRLTCSLEDAGFEIREGTFGWLTWQGFPKSKAMGAAIDEMLGVEREVVGSDTKARSTSGASALPTLGGETVYQTWDITSPTSDLARTHEGWGTALKPAIEPAVIARKPLDKIPPEEVADLIGQDLYWSSKSALASEPQPGDSKDMTAKRKASAKQWGCDVPEGAHEWRARPLRPDVEGRCELRVDGEIVATREGPKYSKAPLQTVALNVLKWGTGALNIDAARHPYGDKSWPGPQDKPQDTDTSWSAGNPGVRYGKLDYNAGGVWSGDDLGRWPANVYHCPKPANRERNAGCDGLPQIEKAQLAGALDPNDPVSERFKSQPMGNSHSTVKPVGLFRQLLRLITPPGGVIGEWFGGSGTTPVAAAGLDCSVIICEMEPKYADIIRARVEHSLRPREDDKKAPA